MRRFLSANVASTNEDFMNEKMSQEGRHGELRPNVKRIILEESTIKVRSKCAWKELWGVIVVVSQLAQELALDAKV
jgi:hypothetical protein